MTNSPKRADIPYDRGAVAAMIQRLHALKAQRLADEAAQTPHELSPMRAPGSSAPPATTTLAYTGESSLHSHSASLAGPAVPEPAAQQLGLLDL